MFHHCFSCVVRRKKEKMRIDFRFVQIYACMNGSIILFFVSIFVVLVVLIEIASSFLSLDFIGPTRVNMSK